MHFSISKSVLVKKISHRHRLQRVPPPHPGRAQAVPQRPEEGERNTRPIHSTVPLGLEGGGASNTEIAACTPIIKGGVKQV